MVSATPAGVFYPDIASAQDDLSGLVHRPAAIRYWSDGLITDVRLGYYRGGGLVHVPDGSPMRAMKTPPWTSVDPYEMTRRGQWSGCDAMYRFPTQNWCYFERLLRREPLERNIDLGLCAGVSIYKTPDGSFPVIEVVDFKVDLVHRFPRSGAPGVLSVKDIEEFEPALYKNALLVPEHPHVTEVPSVLATTILNTCQALESRASAALLHWDKGWPLDELEPFSGSIVDKAVTDMFHPDPPASGDVPAFTLGPLPRIGGPAITWQELSERPLEVPPLPSTMLAPSLPETGPKPLHLRPIRRSRSAGHLDMNGDLRLAHGLADMAAELSLPRFTDGSYESSRKADGSIVTDVDRTIEEELRDYLARERPNDGIIAEEFDICRNPGSRRQWIMDPLDATRNFADGNPEWATLIALVVEGKPIVGVVSAPALGRRWWASFAGGAYTRDVDGSIREISVSRQTNLRQARISHAPAADWETAQLSPQFTALTQSVAAATDEHASFYGQMLVAEGKLDIGGLDPDARQWDIAAPCAILVGAGGTFTDLLGQPHHDLAQPFEGTYQRSMMATNGQLLASTAQFFAPPVTARHRGDSQHRPVRRSR